MDTQQLIKNLQQKGFKPFYFENTSDALKKVMQLIPKGSTVGVGGSKTVTELGLDIALQNNNDCKVFSHSLVPKDKATQLYQLARDSEWYISSTNAITIEGDFVNIDGSANRISSLIFGVPNVIYIFGTNKIVDNLDSAIDRIRNYVAPLNAKRLGRNTPCAIDQKCNYCNSVDCICNATVISHHPTRFQKNVYAIIIDQTLGY